MRQIKINSVIVTAILALDVGCSSPAKRPSDMSIDRGDATYALRERYPDPMPEWAKDFYKFRRENEGTSGKGSRFYLGDSGEVTDRVAGCDVAEFQAKKSIAQQVATLVSGKMATLKEGQLFVNKEDPTGNRLRQHTEIALAAKSLSFLTGVKLYGAYWEERDYSQSGGKKGVYTCLVVAEISNQDLDLALRKAVRSAPEAVEDLQARLEVKEHLRELDQTFSSVVGPSTPAH